MTKQHPPDRISWKPIKISSTGGIRTRLKNLGLSTASVNDNYSDMLEEWFLLKNPRFRYEPHQEEYRTFLKTFLGPKKMEQHGAWYFYPWLNQAVHVLSEQMHLDLRTGRNRNLVSEEEQNKFYNSTIGVLGMSVGSHVALTIAMTGGAKHIRLADPDVISGSNLNRIRTGVPSIGLSKTLSVARQIFEMNPYAKVEIFKEGFTHKDAAKFLKGLDLLVEEMDNPYYKLKVREMIKPLRIPVIMAADNADSIIVDVERYDLDKNLPILHGILGEMTAEDFKEVEPRDLPRVLAKMAGAELSTIRMLESVMQVGKTLYSWPQLGNAATLCGAVLTYVARQIVTGGKIPSARTDFNIEKFFLPPSETDLKKRDQIFRMMGIG